MLEPTGYQVKSGRVDARTYLESLFPNDTFSGVEVFSNSSTSLNSVNGRALMNGNPVFFKFHTEENEDIPIYGGSSLLEIGLPMIAPLRVSDKIKRPCEVYPFISSPTLYELFLKEEAQSLLPIIYDSILEVRDKTSQTLVRDSDGSVAKVHALFADRLTGERLPLFYSDLGDSIYKEWIVNGVRIPWTLEQLISDSIKLLNRDVFSSTDTIIAHGDDHFANQFLIDGKVYFFDPAFAGRMPKSLAFIKPFAHNCLAHPLWYYESWQFNEVIKESAEKVEVTINLPYSEFRDKLGQFYLGTLLEDVPRKFLRSAVFTALFLAKRLSKLQIAMLLLKLNVV